MPPILGLFMIVGAVFALAVAGGFKAAGRKVGVRGNLALPSGKPRFFVTSRRARPTRNLKR